jgi:hypothetical protein
VTKREILEIVAKYDYPVSADTIAEGLTNHLRRVSVYTSLLRLFRQGLLWRTEKEGRNAYVLSVRGKKKLAYLRQRSN